MSAYTIHDAIVGYLVRTRGKNYGEILAHLRGRYGVGTPLAVSVMSTLHYYNVINGGPREGIDLVRLVR